VGRDDELLTIRRLLEDSAGGVVTVTGPPGVGKTRLAVAAAAAAASHYVDGVAFVDLAEVRDAALVPAAVLAAVGVDDVDLPETTEELRRTLIDKNLLLLIDNWEHVLDAGLSTAAALAGCPGLRLLATSRERLHLRAEREVPLRPLGLPREDDDLGRLAAAPAIEMLVQCVRRFEPGFEVTPDNRAALVEICTRLDGLPLALELAAARLKLFTPGELTFRLRHRMSILIGSVRDVPPRHRTLRAALAWSHDLLRPDERAAFRRLSVFAGGATLEAAGQVCELGDPVATITSLVDKSLLQRRIRPGGVTEFVMLESLREYAGVLLAEHGEQEEVEARHARYFADVAILVDTAVGETGRAEWAESVGIEQGNLWKALAYAMAVADAGLSLPLAAILGWYASVPAGDKPPLPDRAPAVVDPGHRRGAGESLSHALLAAAAPALGHGDLDDVEVLLGRVLAVDEDRQCTAIAAAVLGHVARARGHTDRAVGHHVRAADLFGALGNLPGLAWSRYDLALLARLQGDAAGAAGLLRESLTRFRETGDVRAAACVAWALTVVEESPRLRADGVERLLVEARGCCWLARVHPGVATCLAETPPEGCARREPRVFPSRLDRVEVAPMLMAVPVTGVDRGPAAPADDAWSVRGLTVRERQVARLVADGSTNRQIGRVLGIAEKTTEAHVHNIIRKLGAHNRAEVAARVSVHDEAGRRAAGGPLDGSPDTGKGSGTRTTDAV
jgi:predicted ATPase/DNA-binding CsgD family transcriptional regulator